MPSARLCVHTRTCIPFPFHSRVIPPYVNPSAHDREVPPQAWVIAQLRTSVFGAEIELLAWELELLGYTTVTIQNHLHAAGHVAHWMEGRSIPVSLLDESMLQQFATQHVRQCRCRVPRATGPDVRGVAPHLPKLLRASGRVPRPIVPALTPMEMILDAFRIFLRDHRGARRRTSTLRRTSR